jgi:hypothetical protein
VRGGNLEDDAHLVFGLSFFFFFSLKADIYKKLKKS